MALGLKIAELYGEIRLRGVAVARRQLSRFKTLLRGTTINLRRLSSTMFRWGRRAFVALTAAIIGSIAAAARFDKQMAMVSTMLETKAMPVMEKFRLTIKSMAIEYGQSTGALAKGLYDILSASIATDKAINVLRASTDAATAGFTDTATATRAMVTILNSYQISADNAADVSDWMFAVVKRGVLTFEELAGSIGMAAATASRAGISLDELGASMSTFTRAGLNAHQAATAVVGILRSFMKPTGEAAELAQALGFELKTATLRGMGFAGVLKKLKGLQMEHLAALFPNIRGLRGVAAAIGDVLGYEKDLDIQSKRLGLTQDAKAKAMATLSKKFDQFKESVKAVAVTLGEVFMGEAGATLKQAQVWAKSIEDWIRFNKDDIVTGITEIAGAMQMLAQAIIPLIRIASALPRFGAAIERWTDAGRRIGGAGARVAFRKPRARAEAQIGILGQISRAKRVGAFEQLAPYERAALKGAAGIPGYKTLEVRDRAVTEALQKLNIIMDRMRVILENDQMSYGPEGA